MNFDGIDWNLAERFWTKKGDRNDQEDEEFIRAQTWKVITCGVYFLMIDCTRFEI
jgi:hypothetical protein